MGIIEELGLQEADIGALMDDRPARRPTRGPSPEETLRELHALLERAKPGLDRQRKGDEVSERALARAAQLVEAVHAGESIGVVAERLGVSLPLADLAHSYAVANLDLPLDVRARLGRPREAAERAAMVEAFGGEERVETLAQELAEGMRECGA